jgi:putative membrane protein
MRYELLAAAVVTTLVAGCGREATREGGELNPEGMTPAERTGAASAPGMQGGPAGAMATLGPEEQQFVQKATEGNQLEVRLGELAQDRATNEQVRQLGRRLADEHARADQELRSMAGGADVSPADRPGTDQADVRQRLEGLKGAAFDRAYVEEIIKLHQQDIETFERAAQMGGQVGAYAQQTLPALRAHLEEAQRVQQQLGTTRR